MSRGILLDTHAVLWALGDPSRLGEDAKRLLSDSSIRCLISVGSLWEISIKQSVGKLTVPTGFFDDLFHLGFERLSITDEHLSRYRELPLLHRDPFDRLLVAQAQTEGISLVSCDPKVHLYEVSWVW